MKILIRCFSPRLIEATLLLSMATLLLATTGCGNSEPARFRLNTLEVLEKETPAAQQQKIVNLLGAMFGTPDEPFVLSVTGLNEAMIHRAAGAVSSDEQGTHTGLFRRHCVHCHGITGDGAGPTAAFLNPYPRDYRPGIFKFKGTPGKSPPTREELKKTLVRGIPGTAMPSFRLLPDDELDALVEYVVYLSIRGQMERELFAEYFDLSEDEELDTSREFLVDDKLQSIADNWNNAGETVVHPTPDGMPGTDRSEAERLASVEAGRKLFQDVNKGNCFSCHGHGALGDGQLDLFDDWSKPVKEYQDSHPETNLTALGILPPRAIKPRNLRMGVYRGGRRPIDIYWRVTQGIAGTGMPAAKKLSQEEVWQIVDYVLQMPFEPASLPPKPPTVNPRERL